jgi:hypothetical protein
VKVAVIRAEYGKVVESYVFEARLEDVVKDILRHVIDEWKPGESDLVVTKETFSLTVAGEAEEDVIRELEEAGLVSREGDTVRVAVPIYYINFDVDLDEEEGYIVKKLYLIAPLITKEFKYELENEAASLTASGEEPSGVSVV